MGKPIKKSNFGPNTGTGTIIVDGVRWSNNDTDTNAYIVSQPGDTAYIVQNQAGTMSETVFMVNANALTALSKGQFYVLAIPYGGAPKPCGKITQHRVDLFDTPNSTATQIGVVTTALTSYSWSQSGASSVGEANLVGRPYATVAPTISGTVTAGAGTLTATGGTWTSTIAGVTFGLTYQWYKNGTLISGATSTAYAVTGAVATDKFTAVVTATKSGPTADVYIYGTASVTYTVV